MADILKVAMKQIMKIIIRTDRDGIFVMTCEELPGLLLASNDFQALNRDLPKAIKILYKDNFNVDVDAYEIKDLIQNDTELETTSIWKDPSGKTILMSHFVPHFAEDDSIVKEFG